MSGLKILGITVLQSNAEVELRQLFDAQKTTLTDQKRKISDHINRWENKLIKEIQRHASEQRALLERQYESELMDLEDKLEDFIRTIRVTGQAKQYEATKRLLEISRSLRFELDELQYHQRTLEFVQVPRHKSIRVNPNQSDPNESQQEARSRERPREDVYKQETVLRLNAGTQLTATEPANGYRPLVTSRYPPNSDLAERCPICFMIFSSTMPARLRIEHVHEHYTDD